MPGDARRLLAAEGPTAFLNGITAGAGHGAEGFTSVVERVRKP
ncbi:hypothetical protein [Streptomyces millisiae]|uniref:Uncharacterized protein n=1 Tax=Streptomyces millisiae TaxID=3075542 RepID=A0ABU2LT91_9ACTN|nr:hypothetical protein [Streptomyces sp. DSM 44918]MDT0320814.1 hypothetical protein [Streptomyces sp. DSM 44918]